jgi:aminopeptidase
MTFTPEDARLDTMADVAVSVGLDLQPGQEVILTTAVEALPLARKVTERAYAKGARQVTVFLSDDDIARARFTHGTEAAFDAAPSWLFEGMGAAYRDGAARLVIKGDDPRMFAGLDAAKVARSARAMSKAGKPAMEPIVKSLTNWSIMAWPSAGWARTVFPELDVETAQAKLFDAIFAASRMDVADPVAEWKAHSAALDARCTWLNTHRFDALRYRGPGTDLTLGLAQDHLWKGGGEETASGHFFIANIPTEEVFTCPDRNRAEGWLSATMPLAYQGEVIEGIRARFEAGRIVEMTAEKGEDAFRNLIDTDEGAARLGEVALVPASSPIAQTGTLFYNTLFDENAACHVAQGQCYSINIEGSETMSDEEVLAKGGNQSLVHVDWMVGSAELDVDGVMADGSVVPVLRAGEWASA